MEPKLPLKDIAPATVRNLALLIYAAAGRWALVTLGIEEEALVNALTVALTVGFYLLVAVTEKFFPKAGALLGWARSPVYAKVGSDGSVDITSLPTLHVPKVTE